MLQCICCIVGVNPCPVLLTAVATAVLVVSGNVTERMAVGEPLNADDKRGVPYIIFTFLQQLRRGTATGFRIFGNRGN